MNPVRPASLYMLLAIMWVPSEDIRYSNRNEVYVSANTESVTDDTERIYTSDS